MVLIKWLVAHHKTRPFLWDVVTMDLLLKQRSVKNRFISTDWFEGMIQYKKYQPDKPQREVELVFRRYAR